MKINELHGYNLNYWTAKAAGISFKIDPVDYGPIVKTETGWVSYNPVVNWSQCGPLIERFEVEVTKPVPDNPAILGHGWIVRLDGWFFESNELKTAICRAVVASVYGEEINDEV